MKLKRYFSIFIMLVLFSALLPTAAFAADYSVTGDQELYEILPAGRLNGGDTLTIAAGATLTIAAGHTLYVASGAAITNNGTITNNGAMDGNTGTVTNNFGSMDDNSGSVTNNFGTVNSTGSGSVTNNFGGSVEGNHYIIHNYYQVTVIDGNGTTNTLTAAGGRLWLLPNTSATFTPDPGYVIIDARSNNQQAPITLNSDGTWTLTANVGNTSPTEVTLIVKQPLTGLTLSTNAPTVGTPITATVAPAGATVTYQWFENNYSSTAYGTPINNGANSASYTPPDGFVGKYLYCVATGTGNYTGSASAVTTGKVTASSVPHTGSERQTGLMLTLALLSGAVLAYGLVKRKKSA